VDVETTGFGGDDVLVFLVGVATFEPEVVRVEQWLLDDEAAEQEFLTKVGPIVTAGAPLVTFVGKSFDRHRLDDRFERHGRGRPLKALPHADLYHAARRIFGGALPDVRLATLEAEVLGVARRYDVRGRECPEAWLDYVETRDVRRIEPVLDHNALDVISLVALLSRLDAALTAPVTDAEAAAVGLFYVAAKRPELARPHLERAALRAADPSNPLFAKAAAALAKSRR
jgi:uncharacterized protein